MYVAPKWQIKYLINLSNISIHDFWYIYKIFVIFIPTEEFPHAYPSFSMTPTKILKHVFHHDMAQHAIL